MTKNTLCDRIIELMSDGNWYSTEDLVEKISHRFSATMYTLKKQGYKFEKRHSEGNRYEYRLVVKSSVIT